MENVVEFLLLQYGRSQDRHQFAVMYRELSLASARFIWERRFLNLSASASVAKHWAGASVAPGKPDMASCVRAALANCSCASMREVLFLPLATQGIKIGVVVIIALMNK